VSRIAATFTRLNAEATTGLVTYVTGGDPDRATSARLLHTLEEAGADVIEVGVPFSDPVADGPVIQRASERALACGMTLAGVIDLVASARQNGLSVPIVLFTYANPVLQMGTTEFARRAAAAGVDGVLMLDLPVEEADEFTTVAAAAELDTIFLVSPTTTDRRLDRTAARGRGFLYGISRLGVTGERDRVADDAERLVARVRARTTLPIAVGFGISRPEHVAEVGAWADAAVVGSGLVRVITEAAGSPGLLDRVGDYVGWLKRGTRRNG
jgi:tryptophan synthase alpha chain